MIPRLSKITALSVFAAPSFLMAAPAELARESFDGTGGAIGFATSVPEFDEPTIATSDFFGVTPNNGSKTIGGTITGGDGASMFAGEDLDTAPNNNPATLSVTLNPVNILGKTNTSVKMLLAAPGTGPAVGGTQSFYDWAATAADIDMLRVEASVDGGPFNRLAQFAPTTATLNQSLSLDTDGDGLGGQGTVLTAAYQEFNFPVPTGSTVQVRVVMHSNATNEYLCVDNIRVFGDSPVTSPPALSGVSSTPLVFTEGGAAAPLASALTVTDTDSATLPSASVVITQNLTSTEDVLAATPAGAILAGDILYSPTTGTLTISRVAPLADYQAVLGSVTYRNTNGSNPNTGTRQITFSTTDGINASNTPVREVQIVDNISSQTLPFTESFETDGRGTRYALTGRFTNGTALFDRGLPAATNLDGTFGVIAEDTQLDAAPVKAVDFILNTAGRVGVTATVRLGTIGGSVFDTGDTIAIEASVNGGAYTTIAAFRSTTSLNGSLALDADNSGTGEGTPLGSALQDFTFNMPAANTLGLRIRCQTNSASERLVVDRVAVQGTLMEFSIGDASGSESGGTQTFTVTRTSSSGADTIDFATSNGTAVAGSDFTTNTGTLSFADGQLTRTITTTISPDSTVELDETYTVTLTNPSRGAITDATGTGTITNDDSAVISITGGGSVAEGDSGTASLPFTVSLTNPVDVAVSVDRGTLATGSATAGTDFTALSGSLTIPAGDTTANFNVAVTGDNTVEADETVDAAISNLSAGSRNVTLGTSSATGTITDDDPLLVAGSGALAVRIGTSGKLKAGDLLALTTIVEGRAVSLVSVQSGPTTAGGTVTIVDGWVYYQPPAGFSGVDSFTYTITDGVQTVTGTVSVSTSAATGQTFNIYRLVDEGAGKRVLCLGIPGRTYQLQIAPNVADWAPLGSPVVCPPTGAMSLLDPGPLPPSRFYRVVETAP
jgi:hypothetical protein